MAATAAASRRLLLLFAVVLSVFCAEAFKDHEFKKCHQAHFCKRHRDRRAGSSTLFLASGELKDGRYLGSIRNKAPGMEAVNLNLEIRAYDGGILRMKVNEDPSKKRYEVPDVLEPGLDSLEHPMMLGVSSSENETVLILGPQLTATLKKDPIQVELRRGSDVLISFNSKGLFEFEHLRSKGDVIKQVTADDVGVDSLSNDDEHQELSDSWDESGEHHGDEHKQDEQPQEETKQEESSEKKPVDVVTSMVDEPGAWEESFSSHRDSKPKGPEAIGFDISFHDVKHVYGIPERATSLSLKPTSGPGVVSEPYRLYNLDVFEYLHESPFGLYGSIPFMMSHNARRSAGVFWLNAAEMWVDVFTAGWDGNKPPVTPEVDTHWVTESGIIDLFLFPGPSPSDVISQYTSLTGRTSLPQLFSIAYHQCRWNYVNEADARGVDAGFDEHNIPYDVLWLDIEHTDGKRYMTWDAAHFPEPAKLQEDIAAKGRKTVCIVDPHVKRDDGYPLHREASEKGYYVKDARGGDFDGWCWPGSSSYLDVTSPEIRKWWASKFALEEYKGSTPTLYIWNDMNEPSVFNGPEVTMQKDNIHYGGVEHRDVHNAYGYYYHMATAQGLYDRSKGTDRPFVLSRAIFAGTQRVGPIWTGDNTADWDHLRVSVPMVLTLGVSGMAFSGADVGGFFGNPDAQLMTRWYQLGAFYPFFRGHAHLDTRRREPWLFGEPYTSLIREAIRTRYTLLPYIYTLFHTASTAGTPVMRPLWMEFPQEEALFGEDKEFMLGPSILVQPVVDMDASSVVVYFPGSQAWYDLKTGQAYGLPGQSRSVPLAVQLATVPAFMRAGSIIPRKDRLRRSSTQMRMDPYTLVIVLNSTGQAEGELYVDDGHSYSFQEGAFLHRHFVFSNGQLSNRDHPSHLNAGSLATGLKSKAEELAKTVGVDIERIVIVGLPAADVAANQKQSKEGVLKAEAGPLWLEPGAHASQLIIRKPKLKISDDWTVKLI